MVGWLGGWVSWLVKKERDWEELLEQGRGCVGRCVGRLGGGLYCCGAACASVCVCV